MTGSDIMLVTCALTISLSFPYFGFSMCFARSLPSLVNGRPSILLPKLLAPISSLRYENLVTGDTCTSAESISALNWFQNHGQSVCALLIFVITSFGSFALIDCFVLVDCSLLFETNLNLLFKKTSRSVLPGLKTQGGAKSFYT